MALLGAGVTVIIGMGVLDHHIISWCKANGYDWTAVGHGSVLCSDSDGRLIKPWSQK
jgi:hypothetical protein